MSSWLKVGGNQQHSPAPQQQQRDRQLSSSKSSNKCRVRLGSLVFGLISLYMVGLLALVGWRHDIISDSSYTNNNKDTKATTKKTKTSSSSSADDGPWCHYEGHCPVGTTCVGHPTSPWGGVCQPYRPATRTELLPPPSLLHPTRSDAEDQVYYQECLSKCQTELEWDEHFYYDVLIPKFHHSMRATTAFHPQQRHQHRPHGCVLVFERMSGKNDNLAKANREDWLRARSAQHVIRVDPFIEDTSSNLTSSPAGILWTALCYYPCQSDFDCGGSGYFHCDKSRHVCDRNPLDWEPKQQPLNSSRTVLVTGANAGYWNGLVNFAASARYWAPQNPLVVYNLGLSAAQLKIVESWSNVIAIEWKDGIPYRPQHVHQLKVYAWKPLAVNESVHKYRNIFWLDAGASFTGPIDGLEHYLQRTGIFLVKGQDESMYPRAHESTFRYFHLDKQDFMGGPHFAGGIQGHLFPSRYIDTIVKPNAECALVEDCISPRGSSLGNHRYDQTTLSILAYGRYHKIPHHTEFLAASSSQLDPDLSRPNSMFMWTARQGCSFYSDRERGGAQEEEEEDETNQNNIVPADNNNFHNQIPNRPIRRDGRAGNVLQ